MLFLQWTEYNFFFSIKLISDVSGGSRSSEIEYQDPRSNLERSLINFKGNK